MHTTTGNTILTLDEERKEKLTQKNPKRAKYYHRKGKKSNSKEFQLDFSLNYYWKPSRSMLLMDPISYGSQWEFHTIEILKIMAYKVGKVMAFFIKHKESILYSY